jgi:hypothetical protein
MLVEVDPTASLVSTLTSPSVAKLVQVPLRRPHFNPQLAIRVLGEVEQTLLIDRPFEEVRRITD